MFRSFVTLLKLDVCLHFSSFLLLPFEVKSIFKATFSQILIALVMAIFHSLLQQRPWRWQTESSSRCLPTPSPPAFLFNPPTMFRLVLILQIIFLLVVVVGLPQEGRAQLPLIQNTRLFLCVRLTKTHPYKHAYSLTHSLTGWALSCT